MRRPTIRSNAWLLPLIAFAAVAAREALPQLPDPTMDLAVKVVWRNTDAPVENATVYVYGRVEGNRRPTFGAPRTDADGRTTATINAKIDVAQIRVTHADGILSVTRDWAGGQPRDITITLSQGARVSGVVTIAETGEPVEGARVELIDGSQWG